jgi:GTP-binding protein
MINFNKTKFITSAPDITKLPEDSGIEIAFVGRSNAGKSSALNKLTNIKHLAKTSKTPGRTQLINLFEIDHNKRIVDLPGYGFADVPLAVKKKWQRSLTEYLQKRKCLKALVILMDIRHPLKDLDRQIITWAALANIQLIILLTKADKLKTNAKKNTISTVNKNLIEFGANYDVISFSSLSGEGVEQLKEKLNYLYNNLQDGQSTTSFETNYENEDDTELDIDEEAWKNFKG